MKKIIILLLSLLLTKQVYAQEKQISKEDIVIKYKWYKEIITDEIFYSKKDSLEGYLEDESIIEYGNYTGWNSKYCSYSNSDYVIETKTRNRYKIVGNTRYIKISNTTSKDKNKINIFSEKKLVNFEIVKENNEGIIIKLDSIYNTYNLWFYIDLNKEYTITLSYYENFNTETLTKTIINQKLLIPDYTWKTQKTNYIEIVTEEKIDTTPFIMSLSSEILCRAKEIKTYRYKIKKEYYDNNYYENIDGYIPDTDDYIVEYHGKKLMDITEISKLIESNKQEKEKNIVTKIEYLLPNVKVNTQQISNNIIKNNSIEYIPKTTVIEKYISKEITNKDKVSYILLIIISIILLFSSIINIIKCRMK